MSAHAPNCAHCIRLRQLVHDYRVAREAAEQQREAVTKGYATEDAEYGKLLTFKDYLRQTARDRNALPWVPVPNDGIGRGWLLARGEDDATEHYQGRGDRPVRYPSRTAANAAASRLNQKESA